MTTNRLLFVLLVCMTPIAAKAGPVVRTIAFYAIRPTTTPPTVDGRLDDPCWQRADAATTYYEYWNPNPGLGALKTEFRMLYDERGIYVAVINGEQQLDRLRAACTTRGDPRLWTDDCAEIFFDSEGKGVGFTRFAVNSIGTRHEIKRVDAAVVLNEWRGDQWEARTGKTDEAWTIEAFFPWSDLGRKATGGDLWRFTHVRFAYTSGKFQGVTWAPGANYQATRNLGYVYFADDQELSPKAVGALLAKQVAPPWNLPLGSDVLSCSAAGDVSLFPAEEMLARQRASLDQIVAQAQASAARAGTKEIATAISQCVSGIPPLPQTAGAAEIVNAARSVTAATARVEELYWESRVRELIDQTTTSTTSFGE